jgi:hypothetical protein
LNQHLLPWLNFSFVAQTFVAQQALTGANSTLWNAAEDIDPKVKAISRLVAGWAMTELPN